MKCLKVCKGTNGMQIIELEKLSERQQTVWNEIPKDLLDILYELTWDELLQLIGEVRENYYVTDILGKKQFSLSLENKENVDVYTYNNIIIAVKMPGRPLLQLGIPYKETVIETYQYMDSHYHERVTQTRPITYYSVLSYSMKHPRIQQYLVKKKEEQEKNKEAELLAKRKAAEKGSVEACISLAHYYDLEWSRNGYQEKYIRESVYWLQQAAKKNDAKAIEQLAKTLTKTLYFWEYPWKKEIMSDCYQLAKEGKHEIVLKMIKEALK